MKTEGRLLDEAQMERWPGLSCHFKPLRLSPEDLVSCAKQEPGPRGVMTENGLSVIIYALPSEKPVASAKQPTPAS